MKPPRDAYGRFAVHPGNENSRRNVRLRAKQAAEAERTSAPRYVALMREIQEGAARWDAEYFAEFMRMAFKTEAAE